MDSSTQADLRAGWGATADGRPRWYAAGGLVGALLASTCCIAPLVMAILGISGAWIANLTALEPYKPYFAGAALIFIALGFRHYAVRRKAACAGDTFCARRHAGVATRAVLWMASLLVVMALTVSWWAPLLY